MRSSTLLVDGAKLKVAREMAGLTQERLAQKLHVDRSAVAHWEAGRFQPDAPNFKALCRVLKAKPEQLLVVPDDRAA
ncbi:helix-turn-helix transcriptional regulator [Amycolatopsis sp. NPDC001319]|uniref:helix-turn-helix transcriptional regulator n=1 Tax=unclassified Amycolatopsis TaxID=2618356 RepID=UPI0036A0AAD0